MAVTVSSSATAGGYCERLKFVGGKKAVMVDLTLSGTYVTGGFVLTTALDLGCASGTGGLARIGLVDIDDIIFMDGCSTGGHVPQYTRATNTVMLFECGDAVSTVLDEMGNGEDPAGVIRVMVIGV